ncbi:response regulator transcription factor [Ruminococcus gauvreauii]|uniref:Stage 0 sporulation protein A homolog n=1 Tax=Ruminococcus gauvreauii TaxID=438033 RepID=A0ABY5VH98_9FIRM|nr:response regulator transcription factor [Ruminococcus gauvreauii]UWP59910.1 response regulator transcription factor [Ruminococcus gauvreauii]
MRILLIEDDQALRYSLEYQLKDAGYLVDTCEDGEDAFYYIKQSIYDLILLDRMLPHVDGMTILKKLRASGSSTPVIFLTALGELEDKINGLNTGADDYLVKPFAFEELLARMRCISRRPRKCEEVESLTFGDITYSVTENVLTGPEGSCTLSKKEGAMFEVLLRNSGQILPRMTLLTRVWGPDADVEEGNLDNYMYFIRRRLRQAASSVKIKTIRGVGYQLEE